MCKRNQQITFGCALAAVVVVMLTLFVLEPCLKTGVYRALAGGVALLSATSLAMLPALLPFGIHKAFRVVGFVVAFALLFFNSPVKTVTHPYDHCLGDWLAEIGFELTVLDELKTLTHDSCGDDELKRLVDVLPEDYGRIILLIPKASITSAGFRDMSRYQNIQKLDMTGAELSSADLGELKIPGLVELRLTDTKADVTDLAHFSQLESLYLEGTPISKEGLNSLRDLELQYLRLDKTAIDDQSMEALTGSRLWKSLKFLFLNGTNVTDKTLDYCATAAALEELWVEKLSGEGVTDEAVERLENANPELTVNY